MYEELMPRIGQIIDIRRDTPDVKTFRVNAPEGGKLEAPLVEVYADSIKWNTVKGASSYELKILNAKGEEVFTFGKYKGCSVEEIFRKEPSYYSWMMDGNFPQYTKKVITEIRLRIK